MLNRLTDGLAFQTQALALRAERQRMLAGNIANADTPNYQARDFNFAQALQGAMGESPATAARSHAAHFASSESAGPSAQARVWALQSQTHVDSNGVDMDRERAAFVDNSLKYEATLRFVNGSVRTILDAMKSHNAG
ncbi:MAG: flagellar basal body rod protein FlgB [Burkholderiales bacterium]|uniref:flagellar basal body rod protein FlgB n=1 Tax=Inhella sp. TaxID=1921806 RepID=UPI001AC750AC|nr:flagellar basal body rod protein FlgB [Burkholderiales bacterium]